MAPAELRELPVPTDERRGGGRQVRRRTDAPQGGEVGDHVFDDEVEQVLGIGQVLESVPTEVADLHTGIERPDQTSGL